MTAHDTAVVPFLPPVPPPVPVRPEPVPDDPALYAPAPFAGGVFAAAAPGPVVPVPALYLDAAADALPIAVPEATELPPALLIESLVMPWGRSTLDETAPPSRLSFTLLDTTPDLAHHHLGPAGWVGRAVRVSWWFEGAEYPTLFRGRVDEVTSRLRTILRPDGTRLEAAVLDLAAVSLDADLANVIAGGRVPWPEESLGARVNRIRDTMVTGWTSITGGVLTEGDWDVYTVVAAEVGGSSALDLLRQAYLSATFAGATMVYNPDANRLQYIPRRTTGSTYPFAARLQGFPDQRGGKVQAVSRGLDFADDYMGTSPRLGLDGAAVQHLDKRLTVNPSGGITRSECEYTDTAGVQRVVSRTVPDAPPGLRVLKTASMLMGGGQATQMADRWAEMAGQEMRAWSTGPLRYDTKHTGGGFESIDHARYLLAGWEQPGYVFLQRSKLTRLGVRPFLAILGGTITYTAGRWVLDLNPTDVGTPVPRRPLTIRYVAAARGTRLADVDRSVTFRDLAHVDIGVGFNEAVAPIMPTT